MKRKEWNSIFRWIAVPLSLTAMISMAQLPEMSLTVAAADHDIVILYTNDVHCGVDDKIGYAGLAQYQKEMEAYSPYVTLVDAGDAIQGAPIGTLSDGEYIIDIMNEIGYDVAVPGNHEFDYGMKQFLKLSKELDCGYVSCNFTDLKKGTDVFAPYKMISYGDTDVAYVGVTTPETYTKSTPAYFQDDAGNYIYSFNEDATGLALYTQVQEAVNEAKAAGAEYVILVGHLGENDVTPIWSAESVIAHTTGIDACIDGHSHEVTPCMEAKNADGKEVPITQTGTKLANIGQMIIGTDGTITTGLVSEVPQMNVTTGYTVQKNDSLARIAKKELGSYNRWQEIYNANKDAISNPSVLYTGQILQIPGDCILNDDGRAVDYGTDQFIKKIQSQYEASLETVIGKTDYQLTVKDPQTGNRKVRSGETNLGDLAADAYRDQLGADIGLCNGGGVRADIDAGDITYNDALTVFPFGNMGCVIEATGQQIKDALEMASRNYPNENGGFLQVSGLTYTINSSVPSGVQLDEKENFVAVKGAYRVSDIMIGGQPLDLTKTYTVASHNYMLKQGGDGMTMFKGCTVVKDDTMVDVDVLSGYITDTLHGTIPADYADPAGQGRITIK